MTNRREKAKQATLDEIKAISMEIIEDTGDMNQVTIGAITRKMGITAPAFYRYYKNRQALIDTLLINFYQDFFAKINTAAQQPNVELCQRIFDTYQAYRQWAIDNPALFRLFATDSQFMDLASQNENLASQVKKVDLVFVLLYQEVSTKKSTTMQALSPIIAKGYSSQIKLLKKQLGVDLPANVLHLSIKSLSLVAGFIAFELSNRATQYIQDSNLTFRLQLTDLIQTIDKDFYPKD